MVLAVGERTSQQRFVLCCIKCRVKEYQGVCVAVVMSTLINQLHLTNAHHHTARRRSVAFTSHRIREKRSTRSDPVLRHVR